MDVLKPGLAPHVACWSPRCLPALGDRLKETAAPFARC